MSRYVVRRLITAIPTLLLISFVLYAILSLAPGDPLSQFAANPAVPPEVRDNIRRSLGLDDPWPVRYVKWLFSLAQGNWGFSFGSRMQVWDLIKLRIPSTLAVVGIAYLVSLIIALPIGILSAIKQYSVFDHVATTFAFIGFSVPTFFTGLLLIIILSVKLQWLPFIYDSTLQVRDLGSLGAQLKQSIMPIAVLGLFQAATFVRYTRASMLENLPQDYVRTARAKGLAETNVINRHVVRNSLIPVVTLIALSAPTVFSGALITEQIFRVPGIGALLITSIQNNDIPVIMAITFTFSFLVVVFNVVADVMYGVLDPRIRYD
ncbi:MAG TPA: ABC transporter permease [Chloroflexota bacterium]|nr:ABC transporter permease [Chloroflexota bacterium]